MTEQIELLRPTWAAPARVHACTTTRAGGVSLGSWASLNLADHVGDDPVSVKRNRDLLAARDTDATAEEEVDRSFKKVGIL